MGKYIAKPLVTIAMRTYKNRGDFLMASIESVFSQTYKNIELIILNDGSTDKTEEVVSQVQKKFLNLIYLKNEKEHSFPQALDQIISRASGKYVAFLNGDDYWLDPLKLEKQVRLLETKPEIAFCGANSINVDAEGKPLFYQVFPGQSDVGLRRKALRLNPFAYGCVLARLEQIRQVGGFDSRFATASDMELWLKLGLQGKFYNYPDFWLGRRMHGSNTGETKRKEQVCEHMKIIKKYRKQYPNYYLAFFYLLLNYLALLLLGSNIRHMRRLRKKFNQIRFGKADQVIWP